MLIMFIINKTTKHTQIEMNFQYTGFADSLGFPPIPIRSHKLCDIAVLQSLRNVIIAI